MDPNNDRLAPNTTMEDSGDSLNDPITEGALDDEILDALTPRLNLLDEQTEDVKPTFCTRCRTISASFLSSSYISGGHDSISISSYERNNLRVEAPLDTSHYCRNGAPPVLDDDDVPLLRDEEDQQDAGQSALGTSSLSSDHCHLPRSSTQASRRAMTKLGVACCLTTIFLIGEAVGGYLANSIAIMSDSAHLLSDLTSFIVSLVAIYLAMQPASKKMNFGYYRAEVLGAVVSVLIIWVITGILVYAAIQRVITMEFEVEADTMIIVAAIGVVMNIILGVALHAGQGSHGHSHGHGHGGVAAHHNPAVTSTPDHSQPSPSSANNINVRAAFIHVLGDLIQSIGVLIAAYIIRFYPQYKIADPICTFIFSLLVIFTTVPILKDLAYVLMEAAPPGIDYSLVSSHLTALPGVKMVHSLHVWALTLDKNACVVHLAIDTNTDPEVVLRDAQRVIRSRHHILHTTIQVERYEPLLMDNCHQCQPLT